MMVIPETLRAHYFIHLHLYFLYRSVLFRVNLDGIFRHSDFFLIMTRYKFLSSCFYLIYTIPYLFCG